MHCYMVQRFETTVNRFAGRWNCFVLQACADRGARIAALQQNQVALSRTTGDKGAAPAFRGTPRAAGVADGRSPIHGRDAHASSSTFATRLSLGAAMPTEAFETLLAPYTKLMRANMDL